MIELEHINQIILPVLNWQEIVEHCKRKLEGNYLPGESKVRRAYGLIAGTQDEYTLKTERILTLKKNLRGEEPYKTYMDGIMEQHAVPSKTPLNKRGWISDPMELKECYDICDRDKLIVFGTYHMHVVPWEHDPKRDTPTRLDTILARNSNLFSFIVSMVDVSCPEIRAFYEGVKEKEVPILMEGLNHAGSSN
ncbi:MAG: hypothetical protein U9Q89_07295 [Thermodesulfobacteriota bacterium]|nr:hypothetical protein [Thermodesulfobacteriota bacterium]